MFNQYSLSLSLSLFMYIPLLLLLGAAGVPAAGFGLLAVLHLRVFLVQVARDALARATFSEVCSTVTLLQKYVRSLVFENCVPGIVGLFYLEIRLLHCI